MKHHRCNWLLVWLLLSAALPSGAVQVETSAESASQRVVVEECDSASNAAAAGLRPGDELVSWQWQPAPHRRQESAAGSFLSPFHFDEVELEWGPAGAVTLMGNRDGLPRSWTIGPGAWDFTVRAFALPDEIRLYMRGRSWRADETSPPREDPWRQLAERWHAAGRHRAAAWLYVRRAWQLPEEAGWEAAEPSLLAASEAAARSGDPLVEIHVAEAKGRIAERLDLFGLAAEHYQEAFELRQRRASHSLGSARVLNFLAVATGRNGKVSEAGKLLEQALDMAEQLAPTGQSTSTILNNLGIVHRLSGDLETAEHYHRRSLALAEQLNPDNMAIARSLLNLGLLQQSRGDLEAAQDYLERALEVGQRLHLNSSEVTRILYNLGSVAYFRGDLEAAETLALRSLAGWPEASLDASDCLSLLGSISFTRGDLEAAANYHTRALDLTRKLSPGSPRVSLHLSNLSDVAALQGDLLQARAYQERAQAILGKRLPNSLQYSIGLNNLGKIALQQGEFEAAERYHRQALEMQRAVDPNSLAAARSLALLGSVLTHSDPEAAITHLEASLGPEFQRPPGTLEEAEAALQLARLYRRRGQVQRALTYHRRALAAVEAQQVRAGGSAESHSLFALQLAVFYHETIDLLYQARPAGWREEAFELSERYRARAFLRLLARRDLNFDSELPPELQRRRRLVQGEYDRLYAELATVAVPPERAAELRRELDQVRQRQHQLATESRAVSPKLADLEHADPLTLAGARAVLDNGTLVLSYTVGETKSHLFALGPDHGDFRVLELATDRATLTSEVERLRENLSRGKSDPRVEPVLAHTRRLSALLLAPVADQIQRAERLLIVPDGPLHRLPFSALPAPAATTSSSYLGQVKALHVAASVTVFAQLAERRRDGKASRLVAFGDPAYPGTPSDSQGTTARTLPPLPGSRTEVRALQQLYPSAEIYLGEAATEERVKSLAGRADLVHFACHGLLDDRFPFESALALSLPRATAPNGSAAEPDSVPERDPVPEQDNGLLQVWEIFDQLRLDADLVTLSACNTALGREAGGEGLIGLTRAFQFAGARSVLASQWQVDDTSTSELMQRFYRYLQRGESKAEALRLARSDLIAIPSSAHPYHWAGFQLSGDWR